MLTTINFFDFKRRSLKVIIDCTLHTITYVHILTYRKMSIAVNTFIVKLMQAHFLVKKA